jgi:hypothetical protein
MKKFIVLLFIVPAFGAFAQNDIVMHQMGMNHGYDSNSTVSFYRNLGVSVQKFDNLNSRIKGFQQYKALPEVIASIGFGSITQKGHFVGINGVTLGWARNGNGKKVNSTLGLLGLSADAGYDFLGKDSRVHIYPTVGLGLEGYRARLNKDPQDISFNGALGSNDQQNNLRAFNIYNLFFNYRLGLNFGFQSKDKTSGIGLQLGYTGSFSKQTWNVNNGQVLLNSPEDRLSRLYANLYLTKTLNWNHHRMI